LGLVKEEDSCFTDSFNKDDEESASGVFLESVVKKRIPILLVECDDVGNEVYNGINPNEKSRSSSGLVYCNRSWGWWCPITSSFFQLYVQDDTWVVAKA
jgi:hypothetical protein